jgi:hypothetical protein
MVATYVDAAQRLASGHDHLLTIPFSSSDEIAASAAFLFWYADG